jgi:hypothetical protein
MASVVFDRLWDEAFEREGELAADAAMLAKIYKISSAVESARLARGLREAGRPFFEHCAVADLARRRRRLARLERQGRLSRHDAAFLQELLAKALKGWW